MTDPTTTFGAIPKPEEPPRIPDPQPYYGSPNYPPPGGYGQQPYAPANYSPFAPQGPQANAAVVNNIRIGGARPFNHTWHLVLTLLTCGMWAPVWLIAYMLHPKG